MPVLLRSASKSTGASVLCQPQFCGERRAPKTRPGIAGLFDEYLFQSVPLAAREADALVARPSLASSPECCVALFASVPVPRAPARLHRSRLHRRDASPQPDKIRVNRPQRDGSDDREFTSGTGRNSRERRRCIRSPTAPGEPSARPTSWGVRRSCRSQLLKLSGGHGHAKVLRRPLLLADLVVPVAFRLLECDCRIQNRRTTFADDVTSAVVAGPRAHRSGAQATAKKKSPAMPGFPDEQIWRSVHFASLAI